MSYFRLLTESSGIAVSRVVTGAWDEDREGPDSAHAGGCYAAARWLHNVEFSADDSQKVAQAAGKIDTSELFEFCFVRK